MRLIIFLFLLFIDLCQSAKAETILIFGREYSIVVLVPFILIILSFAFLTFIQLKRKKEKIIEILKSFLALFIAIHGVVEKLGIRKIFEYLKEKLPRKEKKIIVEEKPKKVIDYEKEVGNIRKGIKRHSPMVSFEKIAKLSRDFFKEYLGIEYEATYEELEEKLRERNKKMADFVRDISFIKYKGKNITRGDVRKLLNDFEKFVTKKRKKKIGVTKKGILQRIIEEDKKILLAIKDLIEGAKEKDKLNRLNKLLIEERIILARDFRKVKSAYRKILRLYSRLNEEEKKKIFPKIIEFYKFISVHPMITEKQRKDLEVFMKKISKEGNFSFLSKIKEAVLNEEKIISEKVMERIDKLHEEERKLLEKISELSKKEGARIELSEKLEKEIEKLIELGKKALEEGKKEKAEIHYKKIKELYYKLKKESREKIKDKINRFVELFSK